MVKNDIIHYTKISTNRRRSATESSITERMIKARRRYLSRCFSVSAQSPRTHAPQPASAADLFFLHHHLHQDDS